MDAPRDTGSIVGASAAIVVLGAGVGAVVGRSLSGGESQQDALLTTLEAGVIGVLAVGFAGIIVAASSPKWRSLGETTALVGVGAPLVLAAVGVAKRTQS